MKPSEWLSIRVVAPPPAWDAIAAVLMDSGCAGVELRDQPYGVVAYLPQSEQERLPAIEAQLRRLPEYNLPPIHKFEVQPVTEQNWHTAWRRYFRSRRFGRRIRVQPSWSRYKPSPDEVLIQLDPGLAFGTGGHATTALCLELLEKYLQPGMRVADVGTGTGILAIAAAKLGAREVLAVDNDELAVKVAQGNIERNGVAERVRAQVGDGFNALEGVFDLIVCNIISGFLVASAPQAPLRLKTGGVYLISGTSGRNWRGSVRRAIESAGLQLEETRKRRTWVAAVFRKS
ncbi:MAG: 50S ribosomal protein L11 methyltransferase [Armatimonadetes bacterium JP3_11]|jgi:ribosomal protein L11 methyltransferase|nr:MAG: 50S ribosomal protein L11 methyltransferase [Armatimonadetes bacterium CP1_7O]OYT74646.1 MAG: 50S ribosomal protein L11 methyltransferase [Armatimonadetes bacterium JP3_11]RMH09463.1 MAG: 50S ribosomal protein L11 methyltransferase [Armatimonadota bacterium]